MAASPRGSRRVPHKDEIRRFESDRCYQLKYNMLTTFKLKKSSVVVLKTKTPMPEDMADKVLAELQKMFPNNQVLLPNGAELIIIEQE